MTAPVDISREACADLARRLGINRMHLNGRLDGDHVSAAYRFSEQSSALILALRAALDAAERERDGWHGVADGLKDTVMQVERERDAGLARERKASDWLAEAIEQRDVARREARTAFDAGYARCVRDAAAAAEKERLKRLDHQNLEHVGAYRATMIIEAAIRALLPADTKETP